jgi:hypothetical protein
MRDQKFLGVFRTRIPESAVLTNELLDLPPVRASASSKCLHISLGQGPQPAPFVAESLRKSGGSLFDVEFARQQRIGKGAIQDGRFHEWRTAERSNESHLA